MFNGLLYFYALRTKENMRPVIHAIHTGNEGTMRNILKAGFDNEIAKKAYLKGKLLGPPLSVAAYFRHESMTKLLLQNGFDTQESCAQQGLPLYIALLRDAGADIHDLELLRRAVGYGREGIVRVLIQDADVDDEDGFGNTMLMLACGEGVQPNVKVVKLLLERGADVHKSNNMDWTALYLAARNGCVPTIRPMLDYGAGRTQNADTVRKELSIATMKKQHEAMLVLIDHQLSSGADTNARTSGKAADLHDYIDMPRHSGCIPLQHAVSNRNLVAVEILFCRGSCAFTNPGCARRAPSLPMESLTLDQFSKSDMSIWLLIRGYRTPRISQKLIDEALSTPCACSIKGEDLSDQCGIYVESCQVDKNASTSE
ncbi:hypothetical protein N7492_000664 [Penicillium capsulatum]|uniref:Ankyrin repeat protein n=1 Tax=Penicillium capsulatum TaxID=69766 RepID=A0A9W9IRP9_9EURO|nr:hypothetical protein N7492_000664 [Penicillium capsulatum]KAJ6130277.1 hypothetical protein N7512_003057 [Penicillium capsulatum]